MPLNHRPPLWSRRLRQRLLHSTLTLKFHWRTLSFRCPFRNATALALLSQSWSVLSPSTIVCRWKTIRWISMLISPFRLFLLLRNFSTEGSMILYCGLRVEWILFKSFTTSSSLLCPLSNCNITCKFTQSSLSSHSTFTTSNKGLVTFCSHYHPLWHLYIFHSSCLLSHFIALAQAHAFYEFTISSRMIPKHPVNFIPQNYFIFTSFRLRSAALYSWESLLTIHTRSKMQLQDCFPFFLRSAIPFRTLLSDIAIFPRA